MNVTFTNYLRNKSPNKRQVSVKPTRTRNGLVGHLIQCLKTITGINFNSKLPETRKKTSLKT